MWTTLFPTKNNINVGTAEIIISGIGKHFGSLNLQFQILPIDVPIKPNNEINVSSTISTLSEIVLPEGWQWENPNLLVINITSATAIYVGENKDNYKNTKVQISLQKEEPSNPNPNNPSPDNPNDNNNSNDNNNDNNKPSNKAPNKPDVIPIIIIFFGVIGATSITIIVVIKKIKQKRK